jgi:RND family efflux transporter MFP subunit
LIAAALGCGRGPPPAEEKAPPATVKWEAPAQAALEEWTELTGATVPVPDRVARVTAPVEGRVLSVFGVPGSSPVAEGQRVEKDTPLVQLDPTVVQAVLAKAEAALAPLREDEHQAQYAVQLAQSEVDRLRQLKVEEDQQPSGSRRTLVSPVEQYKAGVALLDAQSKLKGASGRVVAGEKERDSLREQVRLHTLTAPIAGTVGRALVVRGQTLAVGTPVTEIVDLDQSIDVVCYVPPSLVGQLKLGQPARSGGFDPDPAARGPEAEGQIVYIAEQGEAETGNFAVKVRLSNADAHLRANRVLRVRVLTKPGRECLSLRESAVQEDEETPTVVIVTDVKTGTNAEGKEETTGVARRLQVVLGARDRSLHQVEIVSLEDPEKDPAKRWKGDPKDALFVVEGGQGLQTGDAVKLDTEAD